MRLHNDEQVNGRINDGWDIRNTLCKTFTKKKIE